MQVPSDNGPQQLRQLNVGLQESVDQVAQLHVELENIETHVNQTLHKLFDTFQSESAYRRQMVNSFKHLTELLRKCREEKGPLSSRLHEQIDQAISLPLEPNPSGQVVASEVEHLKQQLKVANECIATLQQHVKQAVATRKTLDHENVQLSQLNQGYKYEIEKQMSIFERLNALLKKIKTKVANFLSSSANVQQNVTLYLPDTILSEIRHDVLRGEHFSYITAELMGHLLREKVKKDIENKWIHQLKTLLNDLLVVINNMTQTGDTSGSAMWLDYKHKLTEFLQVWQAKSDDLISAWIEKRQKKTHTPVHQI